MSIISVSATTLKQDESSCEFEVNAKTIQNCPAGKMTVVLLGKEIIVKYACIERNLRNEEEEQVKLGLLNRCFAEASRKRQILSFTGPGVPWQTSFMEQLYVIFDAPPGQVRTTSLSKDFLERFPFKELVENGKYLLVSHGERIETGSITLKVIEGRFEAINEQSTLNEKYRIDIFTPRQRYKSSDVFCHNAVYSIASGQLIEVHKVNSASHKSSVPPFGVSAYHGFLLAHVLVSLHELGWFDLVKLNIGSARSVENDAMMLRCRKNIWNDLLDFIAGAGIIQLTDDKSSYVVKKEAFDVLMAEIGYVKFIQQGYSAVLEETVSLARGEKKYWKDIKRNDSGVGEFLLTYQYNVEPAIFNAIRDLRCKKMAYLGCGGGKKLIAICKENP
ncbi:MAG TPA: hypothetical protein VD905_08405, partial [Flavobacteriales bacterium]|nr:hypothetical protein [Flavobacteriales bacterium]